MSKADKMFEELEFELEYEDEFSFTLINRKNAKMITFIKDNKTLMLPILTIKELKAINEKVKELGWNE